MENTNRPNAIILGQIIKEHRLKYNLSQETAAERLEIDVRTLTNWERGQVATIRFANKRKLHEVLHIPLEMLGLQEDRFTTDGALDLHEQIDSFLERGAYTSVREASDLLIRECLALGSTSHPKIPLTLAHAYYTKALSIATLTNNPQEALKWYKRMEKVVGGLSNNTDGLAIARTYQGDMYRRMREYNKAEKLLEAALEVFKKGQPSAMRVSVLGDYYQLLGRVYLGKNEKQKALDSLKRAEEQAHLAVHGQEHDWYTCFCLCGVKEELTKSLMLLSEYEMSLHALEEVRHLALSAAPRWAIPNAITQGELFVRLARSTDDNQSYYEQGMSSLNKGYKLAKKHNHLRQQQRIQRLLTSWEKSDGLRLEYSQKLREQIEGIDRERNDE